MQSCKRVMHSLAMCYNSRLQNVIIHTDYIYRRVDKSISTVHVMHAAVPAAGSTNNSIGSCSEDTLPILLGNTT